MGLSLNDIRKHGMTCKECANKAGGKMPENHTCTVSIGDCPICLKKDITLIPWIDFNWPNVRTAHLRD